MVYSHEVETMCPIAQGVAHGAAPIPEEAKWVKAKEIKDISGFTHGIGWCAPQQGCCKLTLNVKEGVIQECLVETIGCSGMTHSAAMASEILPGRTVLEALNTDLVCDAINTAMRELFLQIVYGRSQSAFSEGGLVVGAGLEDLGKGLRSQVGTMYGTLAKGPRYLEMTDGYVTGLALNEDDEIIGYKFVNKQDDGLSSRLATMLTLLLKAQGSVREELATLLRSLTQEKNKEDLLQWLYLNHMREEKSRSLLLSISTVSTLSKSVLTYARLRVLTFISSLRAFSLSALRTLSGLTQ